MGQEAQQTVVQSNNLSFVDADAPRWLIDALPYDDPRLTANQKVRIVAPAGSGKNTWARRRPGRRVIAVPLTSIADQQFGIAVDEGLNAAVYHGGRKTFGGNEDVIFVTWDSLEVLVQDDDFGALNGRTLYIDEEHGLSLYGSRSYRNRAIRGVRDLMTAPWKQVVLMTATPVESSDPVMADFVEIRPRLAKRVQKAKMVWFRDSKGKGTKLAAAARDLAKYDGLTAAFLNNKGTGKERFEAELVGVGLSPDTVFAFNSDTKDEVESTEFIIGERLRDGREMLLATAAGKEGINTRGRFDAAAILSPLHPAEFEQWINRFRDGVDIALYYTSGEGDLDEIDVAAIIARFDGLARESRLLRERYLAVKLNDGTDVDEAIALTNKVFDPSDNLYPLSYAEKDDDGNPVVVEDVPAKDAAINREIASQLNANPKAYKKWTADRYHIEWEDDALSVATTSDETKELANELSRQREEAFEAAVQTVAPMDSTRLERVINDDTKDRLVRLAASRVLSVATAIDDRVGGFVLDPDVERAIIDAAVAEVLEDGDSRENHKATKRQIGAFVQSRSSAEQTAFLDALAGHDHFTGQLAADDLAKSYRSNTDAWAVLRHEYRIARRLKKGRFSAKGAINYVQDALTIERHSPRDADGKQYRAWKVVGNGPLLDATKELLIGRLREVGTYTEPTVDLAASRQKTSQKEDDDDGLITHRNLRIYINSYDVSSSDDNSAVETVEPDVAASASFLASDAAKPHGLPDDNGASTVINPPIDTGEGGDSDHWESSPASPVDKSPGSDWYKWRWGEYLESPEDDDNRPKTNGTTRPVYLMGEWS